MQALFLASVNLINRRQYLAGAFAYTVLLNFKHIYLYAALAFFVSILKGYVLRKRAIRKQIINLLKVAGVVLIPFIVAFLPFFIVGGFDQIFQIFKRLFPFQRGLIHDYWAPNFWAFYYFLDKVANTLASRFGFQSIVVHSAGELHNLMVLPHIKPLMTTFLILVISLPLLLMYFYSRNIRFYFLVFLCGTIFFMFGFHVH